MSLIELYQWLANAGFPGMVCLVLYLSITGKIRWQREFTEAEKDLVEVKADRDEWKARALRYMDRLDTAVEMGETAATVATRAIGRRS